MFDMSSEEQIQALVWEGGYTRAQAIELLVDSGELSPDENSSRLTAGHVQDENDDPQKADASTAYRRPAGTGLDALTVRVHGLRTQAGQAEALIQRLEGVDLLGWFGPRFSNVERGLS